ncbi:MAG: TIGR02996 domain-containing protein [Planctomycetia bacterium]|nr:TIGR02996 domain-containing protein [Planctomycetia bacterium]
MSEEAALLRAIYANPDDDTARLVYADWLDEHDQPDRAEFIRLQIERARAVIPGIPVRRSSAEKAKPSTRENALLEQHAGEWFEPLAGWKHGQHYEVRRGFPDTLNCSAEEFRDHQETLARWPITRLCPGLYFGAVEAARHFSEVPLLARIRELYLYYSYVGFEVVRTLLEAPSLDGLLWLNVGCCRLGDEGAVFFARHPILPRLRHLDLNANDITADGIRELIQSEHRGSVESLVLSNSGATADDACAFLTSDRWEKLTDLCLWNLRLGDDGVARLAECPALSRLTALNLNNNDITDEGLWVLASSPHVCNLRTLSLSVNKLTSACAEVLIDSPHLRELKYLRLTSNDIHWRKRRKLQEHFGAGVSFELL